MAANGGMARNNQRWQRKAASPAMACGMKAK